MVILGNCLKENVPAKQDVTQPASCSHNRNRVVADPPGAWVSHPWFALLFKVRGPFVQTLCIEKDSYMDAI